MTLSSLSDYLIRKFTTATALTIYNYLKKTFRQTFVRLKSAHILLEAIKQIIEDLRLHFFIETVPHYIECYNIRGHHETSIM